MYKRVTNPKSGYHALAAAEAAIFDSDHGYGITPENLKPEAAILLEALGEYEHGSVDLCDIGEAFAAITAPNPNDEDDDSGWRNGLRLYAEAVIDVVIGMHIWEDRAAKDQALEDFGNTIGKLLEFDDATLGAKLRKYYNDLESPTWDPYSIQEIRGIAVFLRECYEYRGD